MWEKIGLPAKPSMRGANWVVDASHCQGCSSQFTFINRKHHCRRCGGLFCNNCTQRRMILHGQGESAVRICDPCKKLEDAAKFESRRRFKLSTAKASPKLAVKQEEGVLKKNFDADGAHPSSSSDMVGTSIVQSELSQVSPEDMRKQAAEEKRRHLILKGEGKSKEALHAFKHAKELERQAIALEKTIRKNQRLALVQKKKEDDSVADSKQLPSQKGKRQKEGLVSELRELGWSDAELHDTDKKREHLSAESELSKLLKEIPQKSPVGRPSSGIDKTQVTALKKKALMLKKDGRMTEAKEELKRAKILEKQFEEQDLLAEAEDSDDEVSALIRCIDDGKEDLHYLHDADGFDLNFDQFNSLGDDVAVVSNVDVTDDDINDPELMSTLKSFGWNEDADVPAVNEKLEEEVLSLKEEAVKQKKAGNIAKVMELPKQAKLLERDLHNSKEEKKNLHPASSLNISNSLYENSPMPTQSSGKQSQKSKLLIQKELLNLKRKALTLRREGCVEEAEEELKKCKDIERQLEETENVPKVTEIAISKKSIRKSAIAHQGSSLPLDIPEEADTAEVTDQDMTDPSLLSVLESLGWDEGDKSAVEGNVSEQREKKTKFVETPVPLQKKTRNKAVIQRELLNIKRKALALRRQGKPEEADEELRKAKDLENELAEAEVTPPSDYAGTFSGGTGSLPPTKKPEKLVQRRDESDREETMKPDYQHKDQSLMLSVLKEPEEAEVTEQDLNENIEYANKGIYAKFLHDKSVHDSNASLSVRQAKGKAEIQRELLSIKRKARALRQQGKFEEAEEMLRKAKDLQCQLSSIEEFDHSSEYTTTISGGSSDLVPVIVPERFSVLGACDKKKEVKPTGTTESAIKPMDDLIGDSPALMGQGKIGELEELKRSNEAEDLLPNQESVRPSSIAKKFDGLSTFGPGGKQEVPGVRLNNGEDMLTLLMNSAIKSETSSGLYSGGNGQKESYPSDSASSTIPVDGVSLFDTLVPQQVKNVEFLPTSDLHSNLIDFTIIDEREGGSTTEQKPVENMVTLPDVSASSNLMDFLTGDEKVLPTLHVKNEEKPVDSTVQLDSLLYSYKDNVGFNNIPDQRSENTVTIPEVSPSSNFTDLLTGKEQTVLPALHVQYGESAGSADQLVSLVCPVKDNVIFNNSPDQTLNVRYVEKSVHVDSQRNQVPLPEANLTQGLVPPNVQVLARKRRAVALKREGKLAEAREELREAKLLEKRLEEENQLAGLNGENHEVYNISRNTPTSVHNPVKQKSAQENPLQAQKPVNKECTQRSSLQPQKPSSGRDRFKLQQESLAHKRQAKKLRREGRMKESEAEYELAKELESQIEELDSGTSNASMLVVKNDDDAVDSFLDPQLMAALKAIGWQDADIGMAASSKPETKPKVKQETRKDPGKITTSVNCNKAHLEEQIKAERLRALNLKHVGKQAEALDALRSAKRLEKQLLSMAS